MRPPLIGLIATLILSACGNSDAPQQTGASNGAIQPALSLSIGRSITNGAGGNAGCTDPIDCPARPKSTRKTNIGLTFSVGGSSSAQETLKMRDQLSSTRRQNQIIVLSKGLDAYQTSLENAGFSILGAHRLETAKLIMYKLATPETLDDTQSAQFLWSTGAISYFQPNYIYEAKGETNAQLTMVGVNPETGAQASGSIAVVDGMIDLAHKDLQNTGITQEIIAEEARPTKHGTAIASLLVGNGAVKGVARGATLRSYVGLRKEGGATLTGETFWIAEALDEALKKRPEIISLSLGTSEDDMLIKQMITLATTNKMTVIAAAGNGGPKSPPSYPAAYPNVIGVSAVDGKYKIYSRANQGSYVDYAAPGVSLLVAAPGGYEVATGTSFSTAIFSGTYLGLANDQGIKASPALLSQLGPYVKDLGAPGKDAIYGYGVVHRRQ